MVPGGFKMTYFPVAISAYQFCLERFEHGYYTLKHFDAVQTDNVLDLFYFIDCDRLERDCGGSIVFVEIEDSSSDEDWDPVRTMLFIFECKYLRDEIRYCLCVP